MKGYVIVINTNDYIQIQSIGSDILHELQKLVGGYIEPVYAYDSDYLMLVNEDGINLNLPVNPVASALYGYPIFGNAVLLKEGEEDFEFFTNEEACDTLAKVFDFNLGIVRENA